MSANFWWSSKENRSILCMYMPSMECPSSPLKKVCILCLPTISHFHSIVWKSAHAKTLYGRKKCKNATKCWKMIYSRAKKSKQVRMKFHIACLSMSLNLAFLSPLYSSRWWLPDGHTSKYSYIYIVHNWKDQIYLTTWIQCDDRNQERAGGSLLISMYRAGSSYNCSFEVRWQSQGIEVYRIHRIVCNTSIVFGCFHGSVRAVQMTSSHGLKWPLIMWKVASVGLPFQWSSSQLSSPQ